MRQYLLLVNNGIDETKHGVSSNEPVNSAISEARRHASLSITWHIAYHLSGRAVGAYICPPSPIACCRDEGGQSLTTETWEIEVKAGSGRVAGWVEGMKAMVMATCYEYMCLRRYPNECKYYEH